MDLRFRIRTRIEKPVAQVFKAVTDENELVRYFAHRAKGSLGAGATVRWGWTGHGEVAVKVQELIENKKIVFDWNAHDVPDVHYDTQVTFEFEALDANATLVTVSERGWQADQPGLDSAFSHCQGWQHMLSCLKAHLEFGIDLRSKPSAA